MYTTLNDIRAFNPCKEGWKTLLKSLGKTKADDEPLSLLQVLSSNGLSDTLWCFGVVDDFEKEKRLLAVAFAREVQHLIKDETLLSALDVAERYAYGLLTEQELARTQDAVYAVTVKAWGTEITSEPANSIGFLVEACVEDHVYPLDAASAAQDAVWWFHALSTDHKNSVDALDRVQEKQQGLLRSMLERLT